MWKRHRRLLKLAAASTAAARAGRGYHHHRYLIWNDNGVLTFLPKYPIIEYCVFGELDGQIVNLLNQGPPRLEHVLLLERLGRGPIVAPRA